jgi:hypothetical protein
MRMRKSLALLIAAFVSRATPAHALDARSELVVGREFVYLAGGVDTELVDGQLGLGAGITMVSDYQIERYGVQGLVEYRGEHVSSGVAATFGPRQEGRGWVSLDPHASLQLGRGRWRFTVDGGILLRRLEVARTRMRVVLDQLQLHASTEVTLDERWRLRVFGLYSFYDPDPARPALHDVDLGLVVTMAGKPERWAMGGALARRIGSKVWLEAGAAGVVYADGHGAAIVPRAAVLLGAWRGVSVGALLDLVVGVDGAATEAVREIGGLELEYER